MEFIEKERLVLQPTSRNEVLTLIEFTIGLKAGYSG
jgi:hypothetical protein